MLSDPPRDVANGWVAGYLEKEERNGNGNGVVSVFNRNKDEIRKRGNRWLEK